MSDISYNEYTKRVTDSVSFFPHQSVFSRSHDPRLRRGDSWHLLERPERWAFTSLSTRIRLKKIIGPMDLWALSFASSSRDIDQGWWLGLKLLFNLFNEQVWRWWICSNLSWRRLIAYPKLGSTSLKGRPGAHITQSRRFDSKLLGDSSWHVFLSRS